MLNKIFFFFFYDEDFIIRNHLPLSNSAVPLIMPHEAQRLWHTEMYYLPEFRSETNSIYLSFVSWFLVNSDCRSLRFLQCPKYGQITICNFSISLMSFVINIRNKRSSVPVQNTFVAVFFHLFTPVCRHRDVSAQLTSNRTVQYKTC